jgi:3-oxoacyl-[acyl-carrier protein] reductase
MAFNYKSALIVGGSRGVGRDLALKLSRQGVRTVTVARNQADLDTLTAQAPTITTIAADASTDGTAARLLAETSPDLLILSGGHQPKMASITDLSWHDFSANWNADTKITFEFIKAALLAPMPEGAAIVTLSSGAALGGSPLSGGYAGAKKMQHFVSNYGAWEANRRALGLKFYTVYPKQLIAGTSNADTASAAYAAARSVSQEKFMSQWDKPLTVEIVADGVLDILSGQDIAKGGAYTIMGTGVEALA